MKTAVALIAAAVVALGVTGCQTPTLPGQDTSVPASWNMWASCPHGDAGRIKDVALQPPDVWVCVK